MKRLTRSDNGFIRSAKKWFICNSCYCGCNSIF